MTSRLYVVSGCSGSGKSTLLAALAEQGEQVVTEPGREIVKEQIRLGGDGLPWSNPQRFVDLCAERALRDLDRHLSLGRRAFFDRSLVDVRTAVEQHGLRAPRGLHEALQTKPYAPRVFLSPPWKALFGQDAERRHTFSQAVAEYEALVPSYRHYGYEIALLPQAAVAERVSFVLSSLESAEPDPHPPPDPATVRPEVSARWRSS